MIDLRKIGKYEVTAKLGQGSFGVVYRGRDAYLKRDVAIKICSVEDEGLRQRFFREAEISGKLVHKNVVTVYEFGFEGEIPYLVQEMLSGQDLSRIVKRRAPLAPALKLDYLLQVAHGLDYAHSESVIHRDIKPGNIRVLEDGQVKIMDFGIAKLASAETQLTQKGVTMGTASYLPPEQVRGADLDHRADIFSFGVLAYELLTYERPFRGTTLSALIYQILYKVPAPMGDVWPECPEPLSNLVAKCLEKKPERRFGSFAELIPELATVRDDVLAGKWPALRAGGAPPDAAVPEAAAPYADESSDVLSPTAIAKTARGVLEGKVGSASISTPAGDDPQPPDSSDDGKVTRPIQKPPAEALATPGGDDPDVLDDEALKTRILTDLPDLPEPPPQAGASTGERQDLAQEIGELVAQGRLEAAKEQLEATLNRTGLAELAADAEPPGEKVDATLKTRVLPRDRLVTAEAPPAARPEPAGAPAAGTPAAGTPAAGMPAAGKPAAGGPEPATAPDGASDTYRTVIGPPLHRLKWIGLAAAAVLVTAVGWLLLRGGGQVEVEPVEVPAEPLPAPVPAAIAAPASGAVAIHVAPWAEVTEITDADGYVQDLPESAYTPLYLELAPGSYTISLRPSTSEDIFTCIVDVTLDAVAECAPPVDGEASVTDYFKESGWWR